MVNGAFMTMATGFQAAVICRVLTLTATKQTLGLTNGLRFDSHLTYDTRKF